MKVIDLFAGCGGLSLGFEMAGFEIPLAIEKDEWASETYRANHPDTKVITGDITEILDLDSLLDKKHLPIDGIIGGPPCQGFSLSGNRDKNDPRNSLFMEFVRFVKFYKPKFFVMENVTGILSMKTKDNQKSELIKQLGLDSNKPVLLVFGGSQGAKAINEAIIKIVKEKKNKNYQIIWVPGPIQYNIIKILKCFFYYFLGG